MPAQTQVQAEALHARAALDNVPHIFIVNGIVVTAAERHDKINHALQRQRRTVARLRAFHTQNSQFQIRQRAAADNFAQHHAVAQHRVRHRPKRIRIGSVKNIIMHEILIVFITAVNAQLLAKQRIIDFPVNHHIIPVPQITESCGQPLIIPSQPEKTVNFTY